MSVQCNTYVLYGVMLPFVSERDELLEPYMDSAFDQKTNPKDGLTVLDDGMNGKYTMIGHVVAKSGDHEGLDNPVVLTSIPDYNKAALFELITALGYDATVFNPAWFVLSHYR